MGFSECPDGVIWWVAFMGGVFSQCIAAALTFCIRKRWKAMREGA